MGGTILKLSTSGTSGSGRGGGMGAGASGCGGGKAFEDGGGAVETVEPTGWKELSTGRGGLVVALRDGRRALGSLGVFE